MRQHLERVQAAVAVAIVLGFYAMAVMPAIIKAFGKGDVEFDQGMVETCKNVMLILVGFLFGNAVKREAASAGSPPPPAAPGFPDTQPQKDALK